MSWKVLQSNHFLQIVISSARPKQVQSPEAATQVLNWGGGQQGRFLWGFPSSPFTPILKKLIRILNEHSKNKNMYYKKKKITQVEKKLWTDEMRIKES